MPVFARSGSGAWHVAGPDGCRYGRAFDDADGNETPDETVTETDIVAYDPPDPGDEGTGRLAHSSIPRARTDEQRLVLPGTVTESDSDLCGSCRSTLEHHQRWRGRVITDLKRSTTVRDAGWTTVDGDSTRACDWCRAHEPTTWRSEVLGTRVCPACGRLFGTEFGEPPDDQAPDTDRLPDTPGSAVTPIVFGTSLPDYDPTELTGSNRPLIKYREKDKYADIVYDLERTGHGFSADGVAGFEEVRADYARRVDDDESHQTSVALDVGRTPRSLTLEGIFPADAQNVIAESWDVASDPSNWFPIGWPLKGYLHRRGITPSIPGHEPVVEAFPRLRTQEPDPAVDTDHLRSVTESGRYARGERYYERGAVTEIERVDDSVRATVQGSRPYDVQVTLSDGRYVEGRCSCPDDAVPCKHVVATVLASGDVEQAGGDLSLEDVLANASAGELRDLLGSLAEEDIAVRKRIYEELE